MRLFPWIPALILGACPAASTAGDTLPGPVEAEVLQVVDGDTLAVRALIWLGQTVETRVRIAGMDTPERRGDCEAEKALAEAARQALASLVGSGTVLLRDISNDKYGGRVLARVEAADGRDARQTLMAAGLAAPYEGRGPRTDWCAGLPPAAAAREAVSSNG